MSENASWKPKIMIIGGLLGALLGLLASYLLVRMAEESGKPPKISTGNAVKLAVAAIGLVRQATQLGG